MDSVALIIFGITSNLAQIKLIPALYDMAEKDLLPEKLSIIGIARSKMTKNEFEHYFHATLNLKNIHHNHPIKDEIFKKLCRKLHYLNGSLDDPDFFRTIKIYLNKLSANRRIFYLATYPDLYGHIFKNLKKHNLNIQKNPKAGGWVRLMIEKPIGNDLESARALNNLLLKYFSEDQIFRLDHYLGKETLQNILTFRFTNDIFEPIINKDFIDHIQITASEEIGIGARGGYYDSVGALKDVGQNHQLQMLAFATIEAPSEFSKEAITSQRMKILKSLVPIPNKVVFGQYEDYKSEKDINPESITDTFYALKTFIDNERFKDVPIYIRAGKKLAKTVTEISIVFKNKPNRLFKGYTMGDQPNVLIYRIAPNEGIVLKILTKKPGYAIELESEYMQFCYRLNPHGHYLPDPYERLISDTMRGDQTFFNSAEEVETQWAFIDPLIKVRKKPYIYKSGTWGPEQAYKLIEEDGRQWLEPSMDFCRI
jgi:glucose-6-phosphate 1-dehydrogenase